MLQKEGVPRKGGEGCLRKGEEVPILEQTMLATFVLWILQSLKEQLFYRTPPEVVTCRCSSKYVFLEVLQSSQESTCTRAQFLKKLVGWRLETSSKRTPTQLFFCEVLGTFFLTEHLRWLLFTSGGCFCIFLKKYY